MPPDYFYLLPNTNDIKILGFRGGTLIKYLGYIYLFPIMTNPKIILGFRVGMVAP
jgi:hypothetical protein